MASLFSSYEAIDELSAVDIGIIRLIAISVIEDIRFYARSLDPNEITRDTVPYPPIDQMCSLLRDLENGIPIREALDKLNDFAIKPLIKKFRERGIDVSISYRKNDNMRTEYRKGIPAAMEFIQNLLEASWNGRTIEIQVNRK